ncbi:cyclic nucleotide-binding domain-containing protein [Mycobacterium sp. URHB0021]|jgi:CRP/FNR family cyclic AMP-dependent transcriptional regulator
MNRRQTTEANRAREKETAEDVRRLRKLDAFANFSEEDLRRITRVTHHSSTSGPWPLIREQTVSDACYILLSGEAGVYVGNERIAVVGPGEVIGESALRRGKLRNATVTTTGRTEVLRIGRDDLDRLLAEVPALQETLDATVARHATKAATADPG